MVSMGLGQLGVDLILENGHIGFKNKIVLHSLKEVKCHQGYTSDFCYLLFNLLGLPIQGRIQSFFRDTVIWNSYWLFFKYCLIGGGRENLSF